MKNDADQTADAAELRRQAEERLKCQHTAARTLLSEADTQRLLHELQVHQIELEMQNEQLCDSRAELEIALARYTDLYDFAPTGYFTLARDGTILAVNLTGARLVGIERDRLLKRRLTSLISDADRHQLLAMLEKALSDGGWEFCEIKLPREGSTTLIVRMEAITSVNRQECRAAMLDITLRRQIETERNRLIQELQEAAARVKLLSGLLPICCYCKNIRNDRGYWEQIEAYISKHSEAQFTHGICPSCMKSAHPELDLNV